MLGAIGGKLLGGLVAAGGILAMVFGALFAARRSGREAERKKELEERAEARGEMDKIRRDVQEGTLEEKRAEAERWSRD